VKKPITQIVGTYGYSTSNEKFGITYLEFSGSTDIYGSFGKKVGSSFTFEDSNSGFTGFHGRATEAGIVAFGVYVNSSAMMSKFGPPKAELRRDQGEPRPPEKNLKKEYWPLPSPCGPLKIP
jgi:Jacalin-like lectin domain